MKYAIIGFDHMDDNLGITKALIEFENVYNSYTNVYALTHPRQNNHFGWGDVFDGVRVVKIKPENQIEIDNGRFKWLEDNSWEPLSAFGYEMYEFDTDDEALLLFEVLT